MECGWMCVEGDGGGLGLWGQDRSVVVALGVVHSLPRGDLGQSLAGAPQLPCDLSRTHLRRVEEEEEEEVGQGRVGKEKHEVKGNGVEGGGI